MLNKVMVIGRLGHTPELHQSRAGRTYCRFSVASDESYTDKQGQQVQKTEWIPVTTFDRLAENCSNMLRKGSLVFVEGKFQTDKLQREDGSTVYRSSVMAFRVKFLDNYGNGIQTQSEYNPQPQKTYQQHSPQPSPRQNMPAPQKMAEDEVPF